MHQNTSTKSYHFSSTESKDEDAVSIIASKPDRKPAKQADPGKKSILLTRILAINQNISTKESLFSSTESKEEDTLSTTASKPDRKLAKQADP
jgi:hypothetical protein